MKQLLLGVALGVMSWQASAQCSIDVTHTLNGATASFSMTESGFANAPDAYYYNFGDGNYVSNVSNPTHTYSANGTYAYNAYVTDSLGGCFAVDSGTVVINNLPASGCNLSFNLYDSVGHIEGYVYTSNAASYEWFIREPNGNLVTDSLPTLFYPYTQTGTYNVCLYGYDSTGTFCDSVCQSITVTAPPITCDASFSFSVTGNFVSFNSNQSTGNHYWDMGNGQSNYSPYPHNVYGLPGTYTVCHVVTNNGCSDTMCQNITVAAAAPCNLNYTVYDSVGTIYTVNNSTNVNNVVWFLSDPNGNQILMDSSWSFIYTTNINGTYSLCAHAYDQYGAFCDSSCTSVTINNSPGGGTSCNASFSYSDSAGVGFQFIPNTTSANYTYNWNFDDGSTSSDVFPYHAYSTPGDYSVCLTVTDSLYGCVDTYCDTISVSTPSTSCNAEFISFADSISNTVYLWNLSSGNNLNYFWDFGDGNTSTDQFPMHDYQQNGVYTVCLTVWDNAGCSDTICATISSVLKQNGFHLNVVRPGAAVSVEEQEVLSNLGLYPNPASEQVTVQLSSLKNTTANYNLVSIDGKVVRTGQMNLSAGDNSLKLDVQNLNAGIYLLQVEQLTLRLIKE